MSVKVFKFLDLKGDDSKLLWQNRRKVERMYNVTLEAVKPLNKQTDRRVKVCGDRIDVHNAEKYIDSLLHRRDMETMTIELPSSFENHLETLERHSNAAVVHLTENKYEIRGRKNQLILAIDLLDDLVKEKMHSILTNKIARRLSTSIQESATKSKRKISSNCLNASEKVKRAILSCLETDTDILEDDVILVSDDDDDGGVDDDDAFVTADENDEIDDNDFSIMIIDTPDRPRPNLKNTDKNLNDALICGLTDKFQHMETPSKISTKAAKSKQTSTDKAISLPTSNIPKENTTKNTKTVPGHSHSRHRLDVEPPSKASDQRLTDVKCSHEKDQNTLKEIKTKDSYPAYRIEKVIAAIKPIRRDTEAPTLGSVAPKGPDKQYLEKQTDNANVIVDKSKRKVVTAKRKNNKEKKQFGQLERVDLAIAENVNAVSAKNVSSKKRTFEELLEKHRRNQETVEDSCGERWKDERKRIRHDVSESQLEPNKTRVMQREPRLRNTNRKRGNRPAEDLCYIVIDGSNVAMTHGRNKVFSCRGIRLCVDFFKRRGHSLITAFLPMWRRCRPREPDSMTDRHVLDALEDEGYLVYTPSRRIGSRLVASYDDRFILELAEREGGVVVSNDQYRDLVNEKANWRHVIEERLLMYTFVRDNFMVPDDPLGRHGPTLDVFLRNTRYHQKVHDEFQNNFKEINSLYPKDVFTRKVQGDFDTHRHW